ncbi:unnamed protein product, partial [Mesorhabditis belari]|uniref:Uncharacterized protein n=1 Tax=Mesorhabditis belari TaxID=2138241 RepID=A0AAF3FGG6_9BILA
MSNQELPLFSHHFRCPKENNHQSNDANGVDSCQALFVIDGSDLWTSFRGEILSIQTAANSAFASSSSLFSANFWVYGDTKQDQEIPKYFFVSYPEFLNELDGAFTYGGKEYIDGAINKLNDYSSKRVIIILYTASSQNLINTAGKAYKGQARTVAVHQNDGIDASPISNYPSPSSSDSKQITELIVQACHDLPPGKTRPFF